MSTILPMMMLFTVHDLVPRYKSSVELNGETLSITKLEDILVHARHTVDFAPARMSDLQVLHFLHGFRTYPACMRDSRDRARSGGSKNIDYRRPPLCGGTTLIPSNSADRRASDSPSLTEFSPEMSKLYVPNEAQVAAMPLG